MTRHGHRHARPDAARPHHVVDELPVPQRLARHPSGRARRQANQYWPTVPLQAQAVPVPFREVDRARQAHRRHRRRLRLRPLCAARSGARRDTRHLAPALWSLRRNQAATSLLAPPVSPVGRSGWVQARGWVGVCRTRISRHPPGDRGCAVVRRWTIAVQRLPSQRAGPSAPG